MRKSVKMLMACLLSCALVISGVIPAAAQVQSVAQETIVCADFEEAAAVLRGEMVKRRQTVTVSFLAETDDPQMATEMMNEALRHTGVPTQGDYLYWSIQKYNVIIQTWKQDGQHHITLSYTITYYTTGEQETQMDAAVKQLLDQLDVYTAGDYEKICAIYDYICKNVSYDSWGALAGEKLVYSAYAALINKRAVCQGYATLFYRLALELGVDTRLIPGTSKGSAHGWNIVRLNGRYYNVDATWDAELAQVGRPYAYFLRCDANFESHTRKNSYNTKEFQRIYPMGNEDYSGEPAMPMGDLTGDGSVNEDDAIYLLQYVLMPDMFPVAQAVDYTKDGKVTEDDAIYLLQHVLMPEYFPL